GLTSLSGELGGKLLELLKEIVPRLSRVAIVSTGGSPNALFVKETGDAARGIKVELINQLVGRSEDFESAFEAITKQRVNGLLSRLGPNLAPAQHNRFVEFAVKNRLPAISPDRAWVDSGGLIFYGADQYARQRRVATYIDKILKGTKPADLPVEAPTGRTSDQSQNSETDRPHDSAVGAVPGGQGDQVRVERQVERAGKNMKTKITVLTLCAMLFALCSSAAAQQPGKIPWIGYLAGAGSGPSPSFIQGLGDLGYVENKNIGIVFRTSESRSERYPDLAAELIRLKVDVIVADGSNAALAAKKTTSSVPIVMASSTDPVGAGLV